MKNLFTLAIIASLFISCKKEENNCYQCHTIMNLGVVTVPYTDYTDICGTDKDVSAYISSNTSTIDTVSGGTPMKRTITKECKLK